MLTFTKFPFFLFCRTIHQERRELVEITSAAMNLDENPLLEFRDASTRDRMEVALSPLDQLMPTTYTRIFLVFEVADHDRAAQSLADGLQKATTLLPYITGAVFKKASSDASSSDPSDSAPPLLNRLWLSWRTSADPSAAAARMLREVPAPAGFPSFAALEQTGAPLHHFGNALAPFAAGIDHSEPEREVPAFAASWAGIQGGLVLCVCVHHYVMDGTGVGLFLRLWADCTKGVSGVESALPDPDEPLHRLRLLQEATAVGTVGTPYDDIPLEDLARDHPEYKIRSLAIDATPSPAPALPSALPKCSSKILDQAKALLQPSTNAAAPLTTNTLICSLIWSCITRVRATRRSRATPPAPPDSTAATSKLGFAINGRPRLGASFAERPYLGNVNMFGLASLSAAVLLSASRARFLVSPSSPPSSPSTAAAAATSISPPILLLPVLNAVSAATAAVTARRVGEALSLARRVPDADDVGQGWASYHGTDLSYTSWANLGLYEAEWGDALGGCARFVRTPYVDHYDGLCVVLPRRRRRGSGGGVEGQEDERIEVAVILCAEDIDALETDESLASWR